MPDKANLRIDGSSQEALEASLARMHQFLSDKERLELASGLMKIQAQAFKGRAASGCTAEDLLTLHHQCLDGLTFGEVLKRAADLTTDLEQTLRAIEEKGLSRYADLSSSERVYFTVSPLVFSIQNGGLISYYYNSYADHLLHCMESLEALGAAEALRLVEEMNSMFGASVPRDREARNAAIEAWDGNPRAVKLLKKIDAREQKIADWLGKALDAYVRREFLQA